MTGIALSRRPVASLRRNPAAAWRHLDVTLVAAIGAVSALGLVMVFSASRGATPPYDYSFAVKQLLFLVIGALVMAAIVLVDYRRVRDVAPGIYGVTVFLLAAVLVVGSRRKGTQGWFPLGPFQLQPSELAKLGLILAVAWLASQFGGDVDLRRFVALLLVAAVPMGLVLLQPDLGTMLVSAAIVGAMLLMSGVKARYLALLGLAGVVSIGVVLKSGALDGYQKDRLTVFAQQDSPTGLDQSRTAAYNLEQSKIAIGSGGLVGKGLFQGTQTRLGNVPEQRTDFIFTAVGEQLGLVGAGGLLALLSLIVWRVHRSAQLARDEFGSLVCIGVMAMFVFQIFENVGMTMGIMPITGIPLPFMSYGGSAAVTSFAAMGLVLNVHMRRFT
ncbi:MAG: rod shape-determining protein RodA [Actinobacteria bacterium]|nr:rod shape-determining protein RodA [Actinomycetota bacterium]